MNQAQLEEALRDLCHISGLDNRSMADALETVRGEFAAAAAEQGR